MGSEKRIVMMSTFPDFPQLLRAERGLAIRIW
jgi:hypothetical protein